MVSPIQPSQPQVHVQPSKVIGYILQHGRKYEVSIIGEHELAKGSADEKAKQAFLKQLETFIEQYHQEAENQGKEFVPITGISERGIAQGKETTSLEKLESLVEDVQNVWKQVATSLNIQLSPVTPTVIPSKQAIRKPQAFQNLTPPSEWKRDWTDCHQELLGNPLIQEQSDLLNDILAQCDHVRDPGEGDFYENLAQIPQNTPTMKEIINT